LDSRGIEHETAERVAKDIDGIARRFGPTRERPRKTEPAALGIACVPLFDAPILQMLRVTLESQGRSLDTLATADRSETLARAVELKPQQILIAALPPGGSVSARFLCRRLRAELPHCFIVVIVPELVPSHSQETAARLREAGASSVVHGVREAALALSQHDEASAGVESAGVAFAR
jgi:hypothetical protein